MVTSKSCSLLRAAQADELVALYGEGLSIAELSRKFPIYTGAAATRLVRCSVPLRQ